MSHSSTGIDETYIKIKGKWHYLYRAVDKQGQTLDWMLSVKRNKEAAAKFFKMIKTNFIDKKLKTTFRNVRLK